MFPETRVIQVKHFAHYISPYFVLIFFHFASSLGVQAFRYRWYYRSVYRLSRASAETFSLSAQAVRSHGVDAGASWQSSWEHRIVVQGQRNRSSADGETRSPVWSITMPARRRTTALRQGAIRSHRPSRSWTRSPRSFTTTRCRCTSCQTRATESSHLAFLTLIPRSLIKQSPLLLRTGHFSAVLSKYRGVTGNEDLAVRK